MSINITSTSDRLATDSPTSSSAVAQEEGTQKYPSASALVSAVPDPDVIAKLANEFFAALPGATLPASSASSPDLNAANPSNVPGAIQGTAVPDLPREMSLLPAVPDPRPVVGIPPASPPPTSTLTEVDFRAIAASLAGTTALVPRASAPPQSGIPVSSQSSVEGDKDGPWARPPQIPPAAELYPFPAVPAMPTSPPTAPPSGSDLATVRSVPVANAASDSANANRTDPWADDPHFAEQNDMFSFPRVPGVSVPRVPEENASQPSVPASPPVLGTAPAAPGAVPLTQAPPSIPAVAQVAPSIAIPETPVDSAPAKSIAYLSPTSFPSVSELFSFPGVPGAQSAPGVPVLPSSTPTKPPSEIDLGAVPGFRPPVISSPPGNDANGEGGGPRTNSLPAAIESVEFRPDLEPAELGVAKRPLDPRLIRQDFPILQERVHGRPLIWLDNAATTQKPNAVIDRLSYFYRHENSNIHRAAHTLAARATDAYESAREKTRRFLNASSTREIIFVRGTTEGINLVAKSWGHRHVQKDDEVVITWLEHHANIVPWQQVCSEKGARLRVAPVNDRGEIILEEYEKLLSPRTKIVSFSQVSNALGTITPAREMVEMAHRHGARVLVDGAQSVSHLRTDVQALDCDFYVFSGHKVFAPTGIGVVYGKAEVLDNTPPWQGGGNMIVDVTFEKTTYQPAPARFEAGTGNIADAVGLGAALDYVEQVGIESISAYEHELLNYATAGLLTVPGLKLIGTAREKAGVLSFVLDDVRTEDVGAALNQEGIAVRSGHHCAQPILRRMGVEATVRPSLALYNTSGEIDTLVAALQRIQAGRGHRDP